jgi:DNA-directed RNA polymerase specialized sigma24 family protein
VSGLIARALDELPDAQRTVLALWVEGRSIREMAARTAAPVDTVLSRKKYALGRLRRALSADRLALA